MPPQTQAAAAWPALAHPQAVGGLCAAHLIAGQALPGLAPTAERRRRPCRAPRRLRDAARHPRYGRTRQPGVAGSAQALGPAPGGPLPIRAQQSPPLACATR